MNLRVDEVDPHYSMDGDLDSQNSWYIDTQRVEVIDETESDDGEGEDDEVYDEDQPNDSEEDWDGKESKLLKNGFYEPDDLSQKIPLRASTAPARPLTEIENFRRSADFLLLENSVMLASKLMKRTDNKYDLDSSEGQRIWKRFLGQIERLWEVLDNLKD